MKHLSKAIVTGLCIAGSIISTQLGNERTGAILLGPAVVLALSTIKSGDEK